MIPGTGSHDILQERCGKVTDFCKKTPKMAGIYLRVVDGIPIEEAVYILNILEGKFYDSLTKKLHIEAFSYYS
jgi:hypothetical protein